MGGYTLDGPGSGGDTTRPHPETGYTLHPTDPPQDVDVARGTTLKCGRWHVVETGDTCATICMLSGINIALFVGTNPSLSEDYSKCADNLVEGSAYCTGPTYDWDLEDELG